MADIDLVTANRVSLVEAIGHGRQRALVAGEAIVAGAPVYIDGTTGKALNSDANSSPKDKAYGIAMKTVVANEPVNVVKVGTIDGYDLSGLDYDAPVYLSNTVGRLGTTAGGTSVIAGRVVPGMGTTLGTAFDKLLEVSL